VKAVIMAGGRGTRLSEIARDIPKPMVPVGGMPVLEYEIGMLREQGFTEIIMTLGHLGSVIMDYFGDGSGVSPATGKPFGVQIEYFVEETPLGNAGALLLLRDRLGEDFLLLNGDVVFSADLRRMVAFHREKHALATLFVHPNSHPYDSGLLIEREDGAVLEWLTKEAARPEFYHNTVNAGLHVLNIRVIDDLLAAGAAGKLDLDRPVTGFFPGYALADERWNRVTLRHALTHTMGIGKGYLDIDVEDIWSYGTEDFMEMVFREERTRVYGISIRSALRCSGRSHAE